MSDGCVDLPTAGEHDVRFEDVFPKRVARYVEKDRILGEGGVRTIVRYKNLAVKPHAEKRERTMMALSGPGDCSIRKLGYLLIYDSPDKDPRRVGITMEIAETDIQKLIPELKTNEEKEIIKNGMIEALDKLHKKYNMVHGDIKPSNFLRRKDGKIVLCDFETSRPADEAPCAWIKERRLVCTERYRRPGRDKFLPPEKIDDWYSLAIAIWQIYTGTVIPMGELDEWEVKLANKFRRTVDVTEVEDLETRGWIRGILKAGGADV